MLSQRMRVESDLSLSEFKKNAPEIYHQVCKLNTILIHFNLIEKKLPLTDARKKIQKDLHQHGLNLSDPMISDKLKSIVDQLAGPEKTSSRQQKEAKERRDERIDETMNQLHVSLNFIYFTNQQLLYFSKEITDALLLIKKIKAQAAAKNDALLMKSSAETEAYLTQLQQMLIKTMRLNLEPEVKAKGGLLSYLIERIHVECYLAGPTKRLHQGKPNSILTDLSAKELPIYLKENIDDKTLQAKTDQPLPSQLPYIQSLKDYIWGKKENNIKNFFIDYICQYGDQSDRDFLIKNEYVEQSYLSMVREQLMNYVPEVPRFSFSPSPQTNTSVPKTAIIAPLTLKEGVEQLLQFAKHHPHLSLLSLMEDNLNILDNKIKLFDCPNQILSRDDCKYIDIAKQVLEKRKAKIAMEIGDIKEAMEGAKAKQAYEVRQQLMTELSTARFNDMAARHPEAKEPIQEIMRYFAAHIHYAAVSANVLLLLGTQLNSLGKYVEEAQTEVKEMRDYYQPGHFQQVYEYVTGITPQQLDELEQHLNNMSMLIQQQENDLARAMVERINLAKQSGVPTDGSPLRETIRQLVDLNVIQMQPAVLSKFAVREPITPEIIHEMHAYIAKTKVEIADNRDLFQSYIEMTEEDNRLTESSFFELSHSSLSHHQPADDMLKSFFIVEDRPSSDIPLTNSPAHSLPPVDMTQSTMDLFASLIQIEESHIDQSITTSLPPITDKEMIEIENEFQFLVMDATALYGPELLSTSEFIQIYVLDEKQNEALNQYVEKHISPEYGPLFRKEVEVLMKSSKQSDMAAVMKNVHEKLARDTIDQLMKNELAENAKGLCKNPHFIQQTITHLHELASGKKLDSQLIDLIQQRIELIKNVFSGNEENTRFTQSVFNLVNDKTQPAFMKSLFAELEDQLMSSSSTNIHLAFLLRDAFLNHYAEEFVRGYRQQFIETAKKEIGDQPPVKWQERANDIALYIDYIHFLAKKEKKYIPTFAEMNIFKSELYGKIYSLLEKYNKCKHKNNLNENLEEISVLKLSDLATFISQLTPPPVSPKAKSTTSLFSFSTKNKTPTIYEQMNEEWEAIKKMAEESITPQPHSKQPAPAKKT